MASFGHIVPVTDWLHKIPGFKPKYYLRYVGVNDASLIADGGRLSSRRHIIVRRSVPAKALAKLWFRASRPGEVTDQRINVPPCCRLTR
jgi:hypothetical protein